MVLTTFQKLRRLLGGDFPSLKLLQDRLPIHPGDAIAQKLVDQVQSLAHGRVRDAEDLLDLADIPATAEEDEHELLEILRKAEERGNGNG